MFDAAKVTDACIRWIREFFKHNGPDCNAVVGISGGKDSSTVAALCVRALGTDRVIGVLMPNGVQSDIDCARMLVDFLGIRHFTVNISGAVDSLKDSIPFQLSRQSEVNLPARIRMAALYAVSQTNDGRVANTCNLSEDWVGYATRYGEGARSARKTCRENSDRRTIGKDRRGEPRLYLRRARQIHPHGRH